jgi:hypothetical protein
MGAVAFSSGRANSRQHRAGAAVSAASDGDGRRRLPTRRDAHGGNYALAIAVAGSALQWRARAALLKGAIMALFGLWVAISTIHHALAARLPHDETMSGIGLLALTANLAVAGLLYRYRAADSQAMSVWLCTRTIASPILRSWPRAPPSCFGTTPWPDIGRGGDRLLGLSSALQIMRQARRELRGAAIRRASRPTGASRQAYESISSCSVLCQMAKRVPSSRGLLQVEQVRL